MFTWSHVPVDWLLGDWFFQALTDGSGKKAEVDDIYTFYLSFSFSLTDINPTRLENQKQPTSRRCILFLRPTLTLIVLW
jgi:hypothetical protein